MKKILLLLLITACSPLKKYEKSSEIWNKDIQAFALKDKAKPDPNDALLFVGSSSIRLWNHIETDMAPYNVIQRGFGGAKFSDLDVYAKKIIYPHQFKALIVFVANDISGSSNDKKPEEVLKLVKILCKTVRQKYKSQNIYFIGITPTPSRWAVWQTQSQANDLIKNYCNTKNNTYFIETASEYIGKDKKPIEAYFIEDHLHMNQKGYDLWAKTIKTNLEKTLK